MAKGRMTSSDLFEDDYVGTLDFFERLVWIGAFVSCADDQGRFIDNPAILRSKVFPYDQGVKDELIEGVLRKFADKGMILRYEARGTHLIQILNWWKYQSPSWASPSKFEAPTGWTDRVKYHAKGGQILLQNWDQQGGFNDCALPIQDETPAAVGVGMAVGSEIGNEIDSGIEEKEQEKESENEQEEDVDVPAAGAPGGNNVQEQSLLVFERVSGLKAPRDQPKILEKWFETLAELTREGVPEEVMARACEEMTEKKYKIVGPWSIKRPCYVIMAQQKREQVPKAGRRLDADGPFAAFVNR